MTCMGRAHGGPGVHAAGLRDSEASPRSPAACPPRRPFLVRAAGSGGRPWCGWQAAVPVHRDMMQLCTSESLGRKRLHTQGLGGPRGDDSPGARPTCVRWH